MIFICYSWRDAEVVHDMTKQLAGMGRDVWIDAEHLNLDAPMEDQIRQALRKSSSVLLFDSPNSGRSKWVRREFGLKARERYREWPIENAEEQLWPNLCCKGTDLIKH